MKTLGLVLLALFVLIPLVYAAWTNLVQNPSVIEELRSQPDGERARRVMLLSLPSGKSIPVNYIVEDHLGNETAYAAADFSWWRELRGEGGRVEVLIRGVSRSGHARAVEDEPTHREDVFGRLRPTAPLWAGTLIEITLDPRTANASNR